MWGDGLELTLNAIKPNLMISVGSLSTRRMTQLDEVLRNDFPQKQSPISGVVMYASPSKGLVIVGPNQISLGIENKPNLDFKQQLIYWNTLTASIIDVLMLDPEIEGFELELVGTADAIEPGNKAASVKSIQKFTSIHHTTFKALVEQPLAVGARFVFVDQGMNYDCQIEPLLTDLSKFHFRTVVKPKVGKYNIQQSFAQIEQAIVFFQDKWFNFIKDNLLI